MGADELMEWVAYYQTMDDKTVAKIQLSIEADKSEEDRHNTLRNFLKSMGKRTNGG